MSLRLLSSNAPRDPFLIVVEKMPALVAAGGRSACSLMPSLSFAVVASHQSCVAVLYPTDLIAGDIAGDYLTLPYLPCSTLAYLMQVR